MEKQSKRLAPFLVPQNTHGMDYEAKYILTVYEKDKEKVDVGTYHHRRIVPLLVGACSIWIDPVVDDLECCQSDGLHGAKVGLPKPVCLRMKCRFKKHKHQFNTTCQYDFLREMPQATGYCSSFPIKDIIEGHK